MLFLIMLAMIGTKLDLGVWYWITYALCWVMLVAKMVINGSDD